MLSFICHMFIYHSARLVWWGVCSDIFHFRKKDRLCFYCWVFRVLCFVCITVHNLICVWQSCFSSLLTVSFEEVFILVKPNLTVFFFFFLHRLCFCLSSTTYWDTIPYMHYEAMIIILEKNEKMINEKWCCHCGNSLPIPWKVIHGISYDLAILLLNINSKELKTGIEANTCTWVFIVALFTISINRWMNKQKCHIYRIKYYSVKKEWSTNICFNIDDCWKHVKWKKPTMKDRIFYNSNYMKYTK